MLEYFNEDVFSEFFTLALIILFWFDIALQNSNKIYRSFHKILTFDSFFLSYQITLENDKSFDFFLIEGKFWKFLGWKNLIFDEITLSFSTTLSKRSRLEALEVYECLVVWRDGKLLCAKCETFHQIFPNKIHFSRLAISCVIVSCDRMKIIIIFGSSELMCKNKEFCFNEKFCLKLKWGIVAQRRQKRILKK